MDLRSYKSNGFLVMKEFFRRAEVEAVRIDARRIFYNQFLEKEFTSLAFEEMSENEFNQAMFRLFREDFECLANCGKQAQHLISLHRLALDGRVEDLLHSIGLTHPNIATRPVLYF